MSDSKEFRKTIYKNVIVNITAEEVKPTDPENNEWFASVEFIVDNGSTTNIQSRIFTKERWDSSENALDSASTWAKQYIDDGMPNVDN